MKGFIYIAGAFTELKKGKCQPNKSRLDNDPHFWTSPPTWGICRNDLRKNCNIGDYIFFVLPKASKYPQMVFAYLKVKQIITHIEAFNTQGLKSKQMGNKNPNGNIIVNSSGGYNKFDAGVHKNKFCKIKDRYVIGEKNNSYFLKEEEIKKLSSSFIAVLSKTINHSGNTPFEIIGRYGQCLKKQQIIDLLKWLPPSEASSSEKAKKFSDLKIKKEELKSLFV